MDEQPQCPYCLSWPLEGDECDCDEARIIRLEAQRDDLLTALQVVLDQVDYTVGNCRPSDMVGAVLSHDVIKLAHAAIAQCKAGNNDER